MSGSETTVVRDNISLISPIRSTIATHKGMAQFRPREVPSRENAEEGKLRR